jgi:hypothetical protein
LNSQIIDKWLKDDKQRPKKQRHTTVRIYNRLKQENDFQGAEMTVRRYVREAKMRLGPAFCRYLLHQMPRPASRPKLTGEGVRGFRRC